MPLVASIMDKAIANNQAMGITGLLLATPHYFLQVLEGELEAVNTIFNKISKDSRHQSICILDFRAVNTRAFSRWAMQGVGFTELDEPLQKQLMAKYGSNEGSLKIPDDPWLAFALLYEFYDVGEMV